MYLKDKLKKYAFIIAAQLIAYGITVWLTSHVFLGAIPIVRAGVINDVRKLPAKSVETIKNIDITGVMHNLQLPSRKTDDSQSPRQTYIPSPWVFKEDQVPTSPSDGTGSSGSPDERNQNPEGQPSPTGFRLPLPGRSDPNQPGDTGQPGDTNQQPTTSPSGEDPTSRSGNQRSGSPTRSPSRSQTQPSPTRASTPTPTFPPQQQTTANEKEQETVREINRRRKQMGLSELRVNAVLTTSARSHSAFMSSGPMSTHCKHIDNNGDDAFKRARKVGYRGSIIGETIGCGYFRDANHLVDGWWNSPRHKDILTESAAREIGVGWGTSGITAVVGR